MTITILLNFNCCFTGYINFLFSFRYLSPRHEEYETSRNFLCCKKCGKPDGRRRTRVGTVDEVATGGKLMDAPVASLSLENETRKCKMRVVIRRWRNSFYWHRGGPSALRLPDFNDSCRQWFMATSDIS